MKLYHLPKAATSLAILALSSACTQGGADKALSFVNGVDTQVVEFHSAIDVIIVATMGVVGLVQLFFG